MIETQLAEILLCEDNDGDILLTVDAFEEAKFRNNLSVVRDGNEALDYLYKRNGFEHVTTPNIVLLDINMPKTDGKEVLAQVKSDPIFNDITFIVLTSSKADNDIWDSYQLKADSYLVKPLDAQKFIDALRDLQSFYIDIVFKPNKN